MKKQEDILSYDKFCKGNQVIQGFVDMLIETNEGYVLIDHKNYPGKDAE